MSTITYDAVPTARAETPAAKPSVKRKGRLARIAARVIAARQKQAMDEILRYGIMLPSELEQAGWKVTERSEDSLPFVR